MAKKKEFGNIVETSFIEGYESEPEIMTQNPQKNNPTETQAPTYILSETEILLRKIVSGNEEVINDMLNYSERSTYYLTDLHRACIEVKSREDFVTKQEVVRAALERYFDEKTVAAAKEELIRKKIKTLKKEIENKESEK